jgi:hypothetical protein
VEREASQASFVGTSASSTSSSGTVTQSISSSENGAT